MLLDPYSSGHQNAVGSMPDDDLVAEHSNRLLPDGILYICICQCEEDTTVVPALGDPRRERPPASYGHVINAPTDTFQR